MRQWPRVLEQHVRAGRHHLDGAMPSTPASTSSPATAAQPMVLLPEPLCARSKATNFALGRASTTQMPLGNSCPAAVWIVGGACSSRVFGLAHSRTTACRQGLLGAGLDPLPAVLGLCDRRRPSGGRSGDPVRRGVPTGGDPADGDDGQLRRAAAHPARDGRARQPSGMDDDGRRPVADRRGLGLAPVAAAFGDRQALWRSTASASTARAGGVPARRNSLARATNSPFSSTRW